MRGAEFYQTVLNKRKKVFLFIVHSQNIKWKLGPSDTKGGEKKRTGVQNTVQETAKYSLL